MSEDIKMKVIGIIVLFLFFMTIIVGLSALMGYLFMLLWNFIAAYFGFKLITFGVAWAIWIVLCMIGGIAQSVKSAS